MEDYPIRPLPWTLQVGSLDGYMGFIYTELEVLVPESILDQSAHFLGIPHNFNNPIGNEFINAES